MKKTKLLFIIFCSLYILSCEEEVKGPLSKSDYIPPPPTNINVVNNSGSSIINYNLSDDSGLLYVMAVYTTELGEEKVLKSSVFKDYIKLNGFKESKEYNVNLYSVSRSEVLSEAVNVTIHPLKGPIIDVFETVKMNSTFGGVNLDLKNDLENEYTLFTLIKDTTLGEWFEYDRTYSQDKSINYSVRGLEPRPIEFAFYVMDQFRNSSDTLFKNITPLYEIEFDRSLWKDADLPDDSNIPRYGPLSQLWTPGERTYFFMRDMPGLVLPNWVTIDLGRKYMFGRLHIHITNHHDNFTYRQGTPKIFQIWGSNEPTTDWDKWTFLDEFEVVKPSGLIGVLTAEDREQAEKGHEFEFTLRQEGFRYVRFKFIELFYIGGNRADVNFREVRLWGQLMDE